MRVTHVLSSTMEAKSQQRKRANGRRVLTLCVTVCGGKVVGTNQDDERKPARQGHSHPAKHRQRVRLGQTMEGREPGGGTHKLSSEEGGKGQEKLVIEGALTSCRTQGGNNSGQQKKVRGQGNSQTIERGGRDKSGQQKKNQKVRGTHSLPSADG